MGQGGEDCGAAMRYMRLDVIGRSRPPPDGVGFKAISSVSNENDGKLVECHTGLTTTKLS